MGILLLKKSENCNSSKLRTKIYGNLLIEPIKGISVTAITRYYILLLDYIEPVSLALLMPLEIFPVCFYFTFLTDITFKFDIANKTNPADEFAMMIQLIQAGYKVDASVIKEKFGLTVENPTASAGLFSTEQEDNTLLKEDNNDV